MDLITRLLKVVVERSLLEDRLGVVSYIRIDSLARTSSHTSGVQGVILGVIPSRKHRLSQLLVIAVVNRAVLGSYHLLLQTGDARVLS